MMVLFIIVLVLAAVVFLVVRFYPPLGGRSAVTKAKTLQADRYSNGKFLNLIPTSMHTSLSTMMSLVVEMIKKSPNRRPRQALVGERLESEQLGNPQEPKAIWFGHSSLLLQLRGLTLLLDPMFGQAPSPFPQVGGKRYSEGLPLTPEELPDIDAVLLSHDHYDHLDYDSIKRIKDKVKRFIVPLGVGAHLERWGVAQEKITEADWWEELEVEGLKLACTPARHFSGRNLTGRNGTLWCSWVIDGGSTKIFFSGDSGYGPHFREIGSRYGPFDLTLMECGQYDLRWASIHMQPEETVQAHLDLGGRLLLPIHWGAFTLALHDWFDPVERALAAAKLHNVAVVTPRIGQAVPIGSAGYPASSWWREV